VTGEDGGVRVPAIFMYLTEERELAPVGVDLKWCPSDLFAVELSFLIKDRKSWCFARELVFDALTSESAGQGDVKFWATDGYPDSVALRVASPCGHAELYVPRSALIAFLMATENRSDAVDPFVELDDVWLPEVLA
jgi:hypothetical protein